MANLKHVVSDLHQVYLTEMEAKIKPQLDKSSASSSGSGDGEKKDDAGGGGDNIQKAARQLAYDTRYKARREGIPLERAFTQSLQNSKASAPVKDAAKALLFKSTKESVEVEGDLEEARVKGKEKVRVVPKKGYGDAKGYVRYADAKKKHELRSNPQIQSVTPTDHGDAYEGEDDKKKKSKKKSGKLDPVGKEDSDVNNNGKENDSSDKYIMKRRKAIGKAIAKTKKEEFSNWKAELGLEEEIMVEVAGEEKSKKITEKNVKNKIEIHPDLKEGIGKLGGEVLEVEEVENVEEGKSYRPLGVMHQFARGMKQKKGEKREKKYGMDSEGNRVGKYVKGGSRALYPEEVEVDEVYKGKHGQSDKEYADSRSPGGKMVSGDSKRSGAEYTHGRRVKAENPGMQPDVGGKTKPKSQGRMDAGSREDLKYRKANLERKHRIAKIAKEETVHEEKPYERIDRLNKERIAKQKAAKDAETAKRDQRIADFKKFREGERAKGTRHDHILDKWQQKKIAADKAKKQ